MKKILSNSLHLFWSYWWKNIGNLFFGVCYFALNIPLFFHKFHPFSEPEPPVFLRLRLRLRLRPKCVGSGGSGSGSASLPSMVEWLLLATSCMATHQKQHSRQEKIWRSARDAWCIPRFVQWKSHPATLLPAYGVEPRPAGNLSCLVPLRQYEHLEP